MKSRKVQKQDQMKEYRQILESQINLTHMKNTNDRNSSKLDGPKEDYSIGIIPG